MSFFRVLAIDKNAAPKTIPVKSDASFVIIEVRDASGIMVQIAWQSGVVEVGGLMSVGVSWMPKYAGTYELRTFVISGLENPHILSTVSSSKVTELNLKVQKPLPSLPASKVLVV